MGLSSLCQSQLSAAEATFPGARTPIDKHPLAGAATVTPDARPERPPCLEGFGVLALDDDLRRPPP